MPCQGNHQFPTVKWRNCEIARLMVGHNPIKGQSHNNEELSSEMKDWFDPSQGNDLELLQRCEECGINTAQFGAVPMHALLERYREQGGHMQWIATLYDNPRQMPFEQELQKILAVNPKPVGITYWGQPTDTAYLEGNLDKVEERLKRIRQTGVLTGVGSHLAEVIEEIDRRNWDLDFYQCGFYSVYADRKKARVNREHEVFDDSDRDWMVRVIQSAARPCIAFKILGANRKCGSAEEVKAAFRFAFDSIKETDVVLVGMWQKHMDQVSQNAQFVREVLGVPA